MIKKIYHIKISLCSRWTSITMGVPSDSSMRQREESMVLNRKVQDMDARAYIRTAHIVDRTARDGACRLLPCCDLDTAPKEIIGCSGSVGHLGPPQMNCIEIKRSIRE